MKKAFVLYTSYYEHIKLLSNEQAGILFKAICAYECEEDIPEMDSMTLMAFSFIKSQLQKDDEKYAETVEKRRQAGKLGGRPKKDKQEVSEKANAFVGNLEVSEKPDKKEKEDKKDIKKEKRPKGRKEKEPKHRHGEHVLLTDKEYERLKNKYGDKETEEAISYLDKYITEKHYKSNSHNLTLQRWVFDAVEEQKQKRKKIEQNARSGTTKVSPFNKFEQRENNFDEIEAKMMNRGKAQ